MNTKYSNMLRYREAAEFLGISPLTLRRKVSERRLPFIKPFGPNGPVLFDPSDLHEFLRKNRVDPIISPDGKRL